MRIRIKTPEGGTRDPFHEVEILNEYGEPIRCVLALHMDISADGPKVSLEIANPILEFDAVLEAEIQELIDLREENESLKKLLELPPEKFSGLIALDDQPPFIE